MSPNWGPERTAAIDAVREQIRRAKIRLDALAATADAPETSFHLRDEADCEHADLRREEELLWEALDRLTGAEEPGQDVRAMEEALEILRRDIAP